MKIGIITINQVNNYGAELQAVATQKALEKCGYEAEIINYLFYKSAGHIRDKYSRPTFHSSQINRLKETIFPILGWIENLLHHSDSEKRKSNFNDFHKKHTKFSKEYRSYGELLNDVPVYDAYLTGSDQVWNPGIYSSLDPYFLDFAPNGKKRISYAASFGVNELPIETRDYYSIHLNKYNKIGVRENDAVRIVKEVSGCDAQLVLDPTLLLAREEWLQMAEPVDNLKGKKYVLIYELTPCPHIKTVATHIAKETGALVVRVCKSSSKKDKDDVINISTAGPAEFLWLISHAIMIVTNSFHGTAFAINFNKDFYTVLPARKSNNSRQQSLLNLLNLTDRVLKEGEAFPKFSSIDYGEANLILAKQKNKSFKFLIDAINE